jgi:hypothetical protein
MKIFDAVGFGLADIICESIELAFHDSIMPVQYIRQRRNRRVSRNVPRHLREFVAQGQAQLKFQIIAHSVVLLQAACLALPRVLAARHNFACGEPTWHILSHLICDGVERFF